MALADAVQGATRPTQLITWTQADNTAMDLTGATLSGRIKNLATGESRDITGALVLADPAQGKFTWAYSPADVAEAGQFEVQFTAAYAAEPSPARTFKAAWTVDSSI